MVIQRSMRRPHENIPTEATIEDAIADALASSQNFQREFLARCGFSGERLNAELAWEEQRAYGERTKWHRHWWCKGCGGPGCNAETDLFLLFRVSETRRFGLLCEVKRGALSKWTTPGGVPQHESYKHRKMCVAAQKYYMNTRELYTVLIAPVEFARCHTEGVADFDVSITPRSLAAHVPILASCPK